MITMIFKKGDPANADNYRPIGILAIAYKVYASMLKQRLLDAGIDARLWRTQFRFRELVHARRKFCNQTAYRTCVRKENRQALDACASLKKHFTASLLIAFWIT